MVVRHMRYNRPVLWPDLLGYVQLVSTVVEFPALWCLASINRERSEITCFLAWPVLIKNIQKLFSTFSKVCFHILPPVGLIAVGCDASIRQEPWKEITKSHDLWRRIVFCSGIVARLRGFVWFEGLSNFAAPWEKPRPGERLGLFLLHSRILLLDPCVVLIGAKTLNCNNAGRLVSVRICAFSRKED